jgi:hypothetical protein
MLAAEGLNNAGILAVADAQRKDKGSSTTIVELDREPFDEPTKALLSEALAGYTVNIVCLPGSGVLRQVSALDSLGITYRVLEEDPAID